MTSENIYRCEVLVILCDKNGQQVHNKVSPLPRNKRDVDRQPSYEIKIPLQKCHAPVIVHPHEQKKLDKLTNYEIGPSFFQVPNLSVPFLKVGLIKKKFFFCSDLKK